jgi:ubiquinone/menaquinone biosynthesis C-methylase UbiE
VDPRSVGAAYDIAAAQFRSDLSTQSDSRIALEQWAARVASGGRILDVGCGAGPATRWLEAAGYQVLSLDISAEMLRLTREGRLGAWTALADMRALPAATAAFDGLTALFSLLHIPKAEAPRVVAEFRRVVKPGGAVLIAMVRGQGDQVEATEWAAGRAMHFSGYQETELAALLAAHGFQPAGGHLGQSVFHGQPEEHLYLYGWAV